MKSIKFIVSGLAMLGWAGSVFAQTASDALRYSRLDFGGSARVQGLGGAGSALGADFSSLTTNPAGLGLYRRSEVIFTPGLSFGSTDSRLQGRTFSEKRDNFHVANFGVVFTDRKDDAVDGDWRSGSFAIGFTRLNHFHNHFSYEGTIGETDYGLVESFAQRANAAGRTQQDLDAEYGSNADNITTLEGLAYAGFLLDVDPATGAILPVRRLGAIRQEEDIMSRGAQNQWDFAYGASYKDKLFIGGGLGIMTFRYNQDRVYTEAEASESTAFRNLELTDEFTTRGTGINLRLGLIYKPSDAVRFGASIQTPTLMSLTDRYQTWLDATYVQDSLPQGFGPTVRVSTLPGEYKYNLTTPFRATGGIAALVGKYGFLTADIEYVNYGSARFSANESFDLPASGFERQFFRNLNSQIRDTYGSAINLRIGAEARADIFRFRLGYARYGDPFQNGFTDSNKEFYTAGIGVRQQRVFMDMAFIRSHYNTAYSPYQLNDGSQPVVTTQNRYNNVVFTFGLNF